jgi:hypothetical protein
LPPDFRRSTAFWKFPRPLPFVLLVPATYRWFSRNTNKMHLCNRIYYSEIYWRLNMFRAAHRSSSGALTLFAASGLHTHVVTGRSQIWVGTHLLFNRSLKLQLLNNVYSVENVVSSIE